MKPPSPAREIAPSTAAPLAYSICSLVTDLEEYQMMLDSFVRAGFGPGDCEFLYIDNSAGNKADAYAGYNEFLNAARGRRIIFCHQDILLNFHRREDLERRMAELDALDPSWGLLGNAGGSTLGLAAGRISHPAGELDTGIALPFSAMSLDENFIVVKREANLALSSDLRGFHFYGTDLCAIARVLGWTAWVVDFHLYHKSTGNLNSAFYRMKAETEQKYQRALQGRFIQTTCTNIMLGGSTLERWLWSIQARQMAFEEIFYERRRRRQNKPALLHANLPVHIGKGWYAVHWVARLIIRPFENLNHSVRKRLGRLQPPLPDAASRDRREPAPPQSLRQRSGSRET